MATTWGDVRRLRLPRMSVWWTVAIAVVLSAALAVSLLMPLRAVPSAGESVRERSAPTDVRPGGGPGGARAAAGCRLMLAIPKRGWVCIDFGPLASPTLRQGG